MEEHCSLGQSPTRITVVLLNPVMAKFRSGTNLPLYFDTSGDNLSEARTRKLNNLRHIIGRMSTKGKPSMNIVFVTEFP